MRKRTNRVLAPTDIRYLQIKIKIENSEHKLCHKTRRVLKYVASGIAVTFIIYLSTRQYYFEKRNIYALSV